MIKINKQAETGIITLSILGNIDQKGINAFMGMLEERQDEGRNVKLLTKLDKIPGFESLSSFFTTVKMKLLAMKRVSRYAVLSNMRWMVFPLKVGDRLLPQIEIRQFREDQKPLALAWLKR